MAFQYNFLKEPEDLNLYYYSIGEAKWQKNIGII